ncbi:T6SS immunity protein Tli4 family protein [Iodobacter sp. CM08]|uniref:T6SS immunity protein Tli4 family protein n=1 Tax=Iodobacter sp. CM08 TaxID=3085902 RepID=UPI0029820E7D|nr:T6SS immunity protein Tli4 family protein [Iodobacter sp. CM08]MDW5416655.1 T6SS immunity protein Tli4 family protein [Iodobacter sp. CM08]
MNKIAIFATLLGFNTYTYAVEPTMFENTKTYCFGRYLVDVPVAAELKNEGNHFITDKEISIKKILSFDLNKNISSREKELKEQKDTEEYRLIDSKSLDGNNEKIIVSSATRFGSTAYGIDTFKMLGMGYAATTSVRSLGAKHYQSILADYEDYLKKIRYRQPKEIPNEPGFCISNGFVANKGKTSQAEGANLYFVLKNNPYVKIRIFSHVYFKQEQTLLERIDSSGVMKKFLSKVKYNKQGKRIINGLNGEEALTTFPSDDETGIAHVFTWETLGEIGNPLLPSINLEIKTGDSGGSGTFPSTLTQQETMALYETIVKSIRIRPTQ